MDLRDLVPGIIGSFVGVMGWLLVGLYIQRRQFMRQARNAAKAVYFELDVNVAALAVAREHGLFADLDRSSFERLLPALATLRSTAFTAEEALALGSGSTAEAPTRRAESVARTKP